MARPRVFVSSTFYDLKHVRASMDLFINSLGFESILSEKGDIAYSFDRPLDESCYAEVSNSDIFVLIIGGRYGAAASGQHLEGGTSPFLERYESITRKEYERATANDIPMYILIDKAVFTEFETYRHNRDRLDVSYAHVDSINIFVLIEELLARPRNNPIYTFERFTDIEDWLREQWAGLFRDLLKRVSQQIQLRALNDQVAEMSEITSTLKTYMESVVTKVNPEESAELIGQEERRRETQKAARAAAAKGVVRFISRNMDLPSRVVVQELTDARSTGAFISRLAELNDSPPARSFILELQGLAGREPGFIDDLNEIRELMGVTRFRRVPRSGVADH